MKRWPQGVWVVTPNGMTLSFDYHTPDAKLNYKQNQQKWLDGTLAMLTEGVKSAGELKPRNARTVNPFPDRGLGFTRDGGMRLAATVVGLRNGKPEGPPAVDSTTLTKDEWAAFAPPTGKTEWTLPESATKKFSIALAPLTDSIYVPQAKDVVLAEGTAKVLREADGMIVIRLTGKWESKHSRDGNDKFLITASASGEGIALYDTSKKEFTRVQIVMTGAYKHGTTTTPTAAVLEWQSVTDE